MPLRPEYADKYRRTAATRPRGRRGIISRADDEVPIREILAQIGTFIPREIVTSWKVRCPFGGEHKDGGVEQNCRVYSTNSMHCFAMHGTMTNTVLLSMRMGITRQRAAIQILESRNMLRAGTYQERWVELKNRAKLNAPGLGDPAYVVQALQTRLHANPAYCEQEFTPEVITAWEAQLAELDAMVQDGTHDLAKLRVWFESALTGITQAALT